MKNIELRKITAPGVVIFSFAALVLNLMIAGLIYAVTAYVVLETAIPESILKVGSILGGGVGLVVSTALLTALARIKGIVSSAIMSASVICIKIIGNMVLELGGYLSLNGLVGILFAVVFSFVGAMVGTAFKRR